MFTDNGQVNVRISNVSFIPWRLHSFENDFISSPPNRFAWIFVCDDLFNPIFNDFKFIKNSYFLNIHVPSKFAYFFFIDKATKVIWKRGWCTADGNACKTKSFASFIITKQGTSRFFFSYGLTNLTISASAKITIQKFAKY